MCLLLNGHLASGDSSRSQALHPIMSVLCAIVVSLIRCTVAEAISSSWSARGNRSINSVAPPKSRKGGAQIEGHQHPESRVFAEMRATGAPLVDKFKTSALYVAQASPTICSLVHGCAVCWRPMMILTVPSVVPSWKACLSVRRRAGE